MARPKKVKPTIETKLTLIDIIEDNKKYDELVRVEFPNGKYTEVYRYFDNVKIDAMIKDMSIYIEEYNTVVGELPMDKYLDYVNLHILIHFSTLIGEFPTDIYEKGEIFEHLLKSKIAEKVFKAFDKSELQRVFERIYEKLETTQDLLKQDVEMRKQLREHIDKNPNIQNRDIIKNVLFGDEVNGE